MTNTQNYPNLTKQMSSYITVLWYAWKLWLFIKEFTV